MTETSDWAQETLDSAIDEVLSRGLFDDPFLQAHPAWKIDGALLIAECQAGQERYWLIAGKDSPTDLIGSHTASTPQEAARYFALKWQLAAEKLQVGDEVPPPQVSADELDEKVARLIWCAESLLELADTDPVWQ